jgi:hypothetical protein
MRPPEREDDAVADPLDFRQLVQLSTIVAPRASPRGSVPHDGHAERVRAEAGSSRKRSPDPDVACAIPRWSIPRE